MRFLQTHSQEGEIVFTDDWDIFPAFFYYNHHNHYLVGLDPKFTQWREPELWERYVRITRAQIPARGDKPFTVVDAAGRKKTIRIALDDLRDHFGARYVIVDRDHRRLAALLARRPDLAEPVFPRNRYDESEEHPYWIFRIKPEPQAGPTDSTALAPFRRPAIF